MKTQGLKQIHVPLSKVQEVDSTKNRLGKLFWFVLGCLFVIGTSTIIFFLVITLRNSQDEGSGASRTTVTTSTTATTVTTTTVACVSPYARTPNGTCTNLLTDKQNCGSIGNACGSNYTSCSAGVCSTAPSVQLANAVFSWTGALNGSIDDSFFPVVLPFNVTLYNYTTNTISVTTNGVLCLGACSGAYAETALPTSSFAGVTAFLYWDDLFIYTRTSQGLYYAAEGYYPNRTLTFEFYMSHFSSSTRYYHFQGTFFENQPNIIRYRYFLASDAGVSATVGVQASRSGPAIQYQYHVANSVRANTSITFDTLRGTYTNSTF